MSHTKKELYNRFTSIQSGFSALSKIIQNDDFKPTNTEINEFNKAMDSLIQEAIVLQSDTLNALHNNHMVIGDWDNNRKCFWSDSQGYEWVPQKGSHQIFAYNDEKQESMPFALIQSEKRIDNLEDFSNALRNGITHSINYQKLNAKQE